MIRLIFVFIFFGSPIFNVFCQNWAHIGKFTNGGQFPVTTSIPDIVWYDSLENRILVAGNFTWVDSTQVSSFGIISGNSVLPIGCGFETICSTGTLINSARIYDFERYNGELYATGYFYTAGGQLCNSISKWVGNDWAPIGSGLTFTQRTSPGLGNGLEVMNGEMYVYGQFDSINGVAAKGFAKFNGIAWSPVFNFPYDDAMLIDAEWFGGELYVGGDFVLPGPVPEYVDFVKWNGSSWVVPGNGIYGPFTRVHSLVTHNGKLVIGGAYQSGCCPPLIPGSCITSWNGNEWDSLQGGGCTIIKLMVHNNDLYAVGGFSQMGALSAQNIAKWDGQRWCGELDQIDMYFQSIAFKDDTIFAVGPVSSINGDTTLSQCVRWVGGAFGDTCGAPVNRLVESNTTENLILFPNPTSNQLQIDLELQSPSAIEISILNPAGQQVLNHNVTQAQTLHHHKIDVSALAAGLYWVKVTAGERVLVKKLVVEK